MNKIGTCVRIKKDMCVCVNVNLQHIFQYKIMWVCRIATVRVHTHTHTHIMFHFCENVWVNFLV